MTKPSQKHMYYQASKQVGDANEVFLDLVADGMTRGELEKNIERRPALWSRFSNWLDKLPA